MVSTFMPLLVSSDAQCEQKKIFFFTWWLHVKSVYLVLIFMEIFSSLQFLTIYFRQEPMDNTLTFKQRNENSEVVYTISSFKNKFICNIFLINTEPLCIFISSYLWTQETTKKTFVHLFTK